MLTMLWLLFFVSVSTGHEISPVLIWGNYATSKALPETSPLTRVHSLQFQQYLHKLVDSRPVILLFTEQSLSVEDFTNGRMRDFEFPHLHNVSKEPGFIYFTSVESPVRVLHHLTHHGYSIAPYDEDSPPTLSTPTILVGKLREPRTGESRQSLLQAHDRHMAQLTQDAVLRYGQIMVIYTGRHASYVPPPYRQKREVEEEDPQPNEIVMNDKDPDRRIYVVTRSPLEYRVGDVVNSLTTIVYATKETKKKFIILDIKFMTSTGETISLDWVFNSASDLSSWSLDAVKVEGTDVEMKIRSNHAVQAPGGYSYYCGQDIVFAATDKNGTRHSLVLHTLQTQPRVLDRTFGPAADCIPYFSQPIWSGILISSFLLGVLILAVLMLLDIRSNDRFDDPKGKTLSISNTE